MFWLNVQCVDPKHQGSNKKTFYQKIAAHRWLHRQRHCRQLLRLLIKGWQHGARVPYRLLKISLKTNRQTKKESEENAFRFRFRWEKRDIQESWSRRWSRRRSRALSSMPWKRLTKKRISSRASTFRVYPLILHFLCTFFLIIIVPLSISLSLISFFDT